MKRIRIKVPSAEKPLQATEDGLASTPFQKSETPKRASKRPGASCTPVTPKRALVPMKDSRSRMRPTPETVQETADHNLLIGPLKTLTCSKQQAVKVRPSTKYLKNESNQKELLKKDAQPSRKPKEKERIIDVSTGGMTDSKVSSITENEKLELIEKMIEKNDELEQKLKIMNKQVENLENEIKKAKNQLKSSKDELLKEKETRDKSVKELTESLLINEGLEWICKNAKKELETNKKIYETELKEIESNLRKQIADLEGEIVRLEKDAKSNHDLSGILNGQVVKHLSEVLSLKDKLEKSEDSRRNLEEIVETLRKEVSNQASEDNQKSSLQKKIQSLEATILNLNEHISSEEEWNNFFIESEKPCRCKSLENENSKLKLRIKVLSNSNALLEKEAIKFETRNRDLIDFIDIDNSMERVTEINQIRIRLSQDVTKHELDKLKKRHTSILNEYQRWRGIFCQKSDKLRTLGDCIAKTRDRFKHLMKTNQEALPVPEIGPSYQQHQTLALGHLVTAEGKPVSVKGPRFMTRPLVRSDESSPTDKELCDACHEHNPPLSGQPVTLNVDWVGCDCQRWFHRDCLKLLKLTDEECAAFSCGKVRKPCLEGIVILD